MNLRRKKLREATMALPQYHSSATRLYLSRAYIRNPQKKLFLSLVGMQNKGPRLGRLSSGEGAGLLAGPFVRENSPVMAMPRMEG